MGYLHRALEEEEPLWKGLSRTVVKIDCWCRKLMSVVTHTGVEEKLTNEGSHHLKTSANDVSHTKGARDKNEMYSKNEGGTTEKFWKANTVSNIRVK